MWQPSRLRCHRAEAWSQGRGTAPHDGQTRTPTSTNTMMSRYTLGERDGSAATALRRFAARRPDAQQRRPAIELYQLPQVKATVMTTMLATPVLRRALSLPIHIEDVIIGGHKSLLAGQRRVNPRSRPGRHQLGRQVRGGVGQASAASARRTKPKSSTPPPVTRWNSSPIRANISAT